MAQCVPATRGAYAECCCARSRAHLTSRTQVHRARVKGTGDIVAVKLMNLESMNCDLVGWWGRRTARRAWLHGSGRMLKLIFLVLTQTPAAGRDHSRGADHALLQPPERLAAPHLVRARPRAVDGHALCGRRLRAAHHEVRVPRGGVPAAASRATTRGARGAGPTDRLGRSSHAIATLCAITPLPPNCIRRGWTRW